MLLCLQGLTVGFENKHHMWRATAAPAWVALAAAHVLLL